MAYTDPFWQKVLYIYLTPLFRLLHADMYNISIWTIGVLAASLEPIPRLALGILALVLLFTKEVLIGGYCVSAYTKGRFYNNSYLETGKTAHLYLDCETPFDYGHDHGVLMCDEIIHLVNKFKRIAAPIVPKRVLKHIDNRLPHDIKEELRGLYTAVNEMRPNKLTYNDLLMIQMIPELSNAGCTCYATMVDDKITFGRNMDWLPLASAQYTVIVHYSNYSNYCSMVLPGLIGCITAWRHNYVLAMNVVGGEPEWNVKGLPSMIVNKMIISHNYFAENARAYALKKVIPSCSYHLTIVDKKEASCFSYTTTKNDYTIFSRYLTQSPDNTLTVLNWTYPDNVDGRYISAARHEKTKGPPQDVAEVLLKCQNFGTIHSLIYESDIEWISAATNNGFAADWFLDEI